MTGLKRKISTTCIWEGVYKYALPFTIESRDLSFAKLEKVKSMNSVKHKKKKNRDARRLEMKDRIINRQSDTIEDMKKQISALEIDVQEKNILLKSMDDLLDDMRNTIQEVDSKKDEYDRLIAELRDMKKIMDEEVFHRKWWILKHVLR